MLGTCPSSEICISRCSGSHLLNSTENMEQFEQKMPISALAEIVYTVHIEKEKPFLLKMSLKSMGENRVTTRGSFAFQ